MKAAIFEETGKLSVQDKPVPTLDSGDVLIKVELCGICASDLAALNGDITDYAPPVVMGHELAGIVVESRHPDVKSWREGDGKSDALLRKLRILPGRSRQVLLEY